MDRQRLTLDSPIFKGTLRQPRSVAYSRRPLHQATIEDVVAARVAKHKRASNAGRTAQQAPAVVNNPVALKAATQPMTAYPKVQKKPKAQTQPKNLTPSLLSRHKQRILYAMAGVVFLCGLGVSLSGVHTNHQVAAQVKHSQQVSENTAAADPAAPSATKPSAAVIRNYAVSPNLPRYVDIPKLRVHARTLSESVTKTGELQVPWNIYDTGWYNASSQPGQNGAMLIDGHSGIGKTHGVFWQLATLAKGDPITITRGDGQVFTYKVASVQTVPVDNVNMGSLLVSADTNKPGLSLITCTGDVIPGTDQLNKRVLVQAVLQ